MAGRLVWVVAGRRGGRVYSPRQCGSGSSRSRCSISSGLRSRDDGEQPKQQQQRRCLSVSLVQEHQQAPASMHANDSATSIPPPNHVHLQDQTTLGDDATKQGDSVPLKDALQIWHNASKTQGTATVCRSVNNTVEDCIHQGDFSAALHIMEEFPLLPSAYTALIVQAGKANAHQHALNGFALARDARVHVGSKALQAAALAAAQLRRFNEAHHILLLLASRKTMPAASTICTWLQCVLEHDHRLNRFAKLRGLLHHLEKLPYLVFQPRVYRTLLPFARTTQDVYDLYQHAGTHRSVNDNVAEACVASLLAMLEGKTPQGQAAIARMFAFPIAREAATAAVADPVVQLLARFHLFPQVLAVLEAMAQAGSTLPRTSIVAALRAFASPPSSLREQAHLSLKGTFSERFVAEASATVQQLAKAFFAPARKPTGEETALLCHTIVDLANHVRSDSLLPPVLTAVRASGLSQVEADKVAMRCMDFFDTHHTLTAPAVFSRAFAHLAGTVSASVAERYACLASRFSRLAQLPDVAAMQDAIVAHNSRSHVAAAQRKGQQQQKRRRPLWHEESALVNAYRAFAESYFTANPSRRFVVFPMRSSPHPPATFVQAALAPVDGSRASVVGATSGAPSWPSPLRPLLHTHGQRGPGNVAGVGRGPGAGRQERPAEAVVGDSGEWDASGGALSVEEATARAGSIKVDPHYLVFWQEAPDTTTATTTATATRASTSSSPPFSVSSSTSPLPCVPSLQQLVVEAREDGFAATTAEGTLHLPHMESILAQLDVFQEH